METTGNVGRTDELQHGLVVAHGPGAVAFAHVAVQIDGGTHGDVLKREAGRAAGPARPAIGRTRLRVHRRAVGPGPVRCGRTATPGRARAAPGQRSEEHTSELQSLMRISYAVFCLKKKQNTIPTKD